MTSPSQVEEATSIAHIAIVAAAVGFVAIVALCCRRLLRGGMYNSNTTLQGKTIIVTGCNTGIGKETVKDFVKRGARVIMACRSMDKANRAADDIRAQQPNADLVVMKLDLASFNSIRTFSKEILAQEDHIDILVNNAGLRATRAKTEDGYDMTFATNHLGPFLLTYLLLDRIKKSVPARIVTVSSDVHYVASINWDDLNFDRPSTFPEWKAYAHSKLANVLFTKELAEILQGTGVTTYAVHPGLVRTEFNDRHTTRAVSRMFLGAVNSLFAKTVVQGAQTTIYCAVEPKVASKTGLYYADCREKTPSRAARNMESARRLWQVSLQMVGIENTV